MVTMDTELRPLPTATRQYICPTCGRLDSHEEPSEGVFEPGVCMRRLFECAQHARARARTRFRHTRTPTNERSAQTVPVSHTHTHTCAHHTPTHLHTHTHKYSHLPNHTRRVAPVHGLHARAPQLGAAHTPPPTPGWRSPSTTPGVAMTYVVMLQKQPTSNMTCLN